MNKWGKYEKEKIKQHFFFHWIASRLLPDSFTNYHQIWKIHILNLFECYEDVILTYKFPAFFLEGGFGFFVMQSTSATGISFQLTR